MLIGHTGVVKVLAECRSKLQSLDAMYEKTFQSILLFFYLFI